MESRATLRLAAVFLLLVGINVYVFFFRGGTSITDVQREVARARIEARPGHGAGVAAPAADPPADVRVVEREFGHGDSLHRVLKREGLTPSEIEGVTRALAPVLDFRTIPEGQPYTVRFDDEGRLESFELRQPPDVLYRVERGRDGKLRVEKAAG